MRVTRFAIIATAPVYLQLLMCTSDTQPSKQDNACEGAACSTKDGGSGGSSAEDAGRPPPRTGNTRGCTRDSDCAKSEYCARGVCVADVCEQGETRCDPTGVGVILCSPAGDHELRVLCNAGQSCAGDAGQDRCSDWVCIPGAKTCSKAGAAVELCADDGLSSKTVSDCSKTHQACVAGACTDVICDPTKKLCDANAVYQCSADGTSRTLVAQCGARQYCDAASTSCKARVCTPGNQECQMGRPATCNDDGSDWTVGASCTDTETCAYGKCQPQVCKPNQLVCVNDDVNQCASDGLSSVVTESCHTFGHCLEDASSAQCVPYICSRGGPTCAGNVATTCKSDGTGPAAGGTDCGASVCVNGTCQAKVCAPSKLFCKDGNVQQCDQLGVSSTTTSFCLSTEYCDTAASACKPQVCVAGAKGCSGEIYGTCAADGSGYTVSATNCATTTKVCAGSGCVSSAVDEVGETSTGGSSPSQPTFFGNVISVTTSRTLNKIEMALTEPFTPFQGALEWAVYESTGGAFARIATDTTQYSPSYPGSNALSVQLVAGRTYAIGVFFVPNDSSISVNEAIGPEKTSFGNVDGSFFVQSDTLPTMLSATPTDTVNIDRQRLTTTLAK